MAIETMWVLSTAHMEGRDDQILHAPQDFVIMRRECGYVINVPSDHELFQEMIATCRAEGLSDSFINLLRYTRDLGAPWLMLDRDAERLGWLPSHDW